jgi:hypothetical protein
MLLLMDLDRGYETDSEKNDNSELESESDDTRRENLEPDSESEDARSDYNYHTGIPTQ